MSLLFLRKRTLRWQDNGGYKNEKHCVQFHFVYCFERHLDTEVRSMGGFFFFLRERGGRADTARKGGVGGVGVVRRRLSTSS